MVEDLVACLNKAVSTAQQSLNECLKNPKYNQLKIPVKANALDWRSDVLVVVYGGYIPWSQRSINFALR